MSERVSRVLLAARIRPPLDRERARKDYHKSATVSHDRSVILDEVLAGPEPVVVARHSFTFDHAFEEDASEDDVYRALGASPVATFRQGGNACIIAYGQTGTGKSHTLSYLVPRVLSAIFESIASASVSFVEVYNEGVFDLLAERQRNLKIARHPDSNQLLIESLTSVTVTSIEETLGLFSQGNGMRCTSVTAMNHQSSRSHAIFTLQIPGAQKFHFVDLAGSERPLQSSAETRSINRSLSCLGHVISALTEKNSLRFHIPFRDSKLTRILEDSLAPNAVCKTVLLVTVSPSNDAYGESLSTLKFAQRAKALRTLNANSVARRELEDPHLQGERPSAGAALATIRRLEKELAAERAMRVKLEEKLALASKRPPADAKTIETLLAKQRDVLLSNSLVLAEDNGNLMNSVSETASPLKIRLPETPVSNTPKPPSSGGISVEALIARRRQQLEQRNSSF